MPHFKSKLPHCELGNGPVTIFFYDPLMVKKLLDRNHHRHHHIFDLVNYLNVMKTAEMVLAQRNDLVYIPMLLAIDCKSLAPITTVNKLL